MAKHDGDQHVFVYSRAVCSRWPPFSSIHFLRRTFSRANLTDRVQISIRVYSGKLRTITELKEAIMEKEGHSGDFFDFLLRPKVRLGAPFLSERAPWRSEKGTLSIISIAHVILLSVSALRGLVFRRYLVNGLIDQDKTQALGVPACELICHIILL